MAGLKIDGGCHCGNLGYLLDWPGDPAEIPVRACSCSFCTMHGGTYTSHPDATLVVRVKEPATVSKYRFGTRTADFFVCWRCGAVPFVISEIAGRLHAVVNVNTFSGVDQSCFRESVTDFDGETVESRLKRRSEKWIANVILDEGSA